MWNWNDRGGADLQARVTLDGEAVAAICMIRGDFAGALKMQRQMLEITQEDWTTEGKLVDSIQRKFQDLQAMIAAKS